MFVTTVCITFLFLGRILWLRFRGWAGLAGLLMAAGGVAGVVIVLAGAANSRRRTFE
jgi:hypothetical protein